MVRVLEDVTSAVFPPCCRRCGAELPCDQPVPAAAARYAALWDGSLRRALAGPLSLPAYIACPACAATLELAPPPRPLAGTAARCITGFEPCPLLFDLLHAFKYEAQVHLAAWLGEFLAAAVQDSGMQDLLLVPVPLHPSSERQRGFNQSELLAREIGRRVGAPVAGDLVERRRATAPQAKLDDAKRRANVAGAFRRRGVPPARRTVALVDDVTTTGATLAAVREAIGTDPERTVVVALCRAGGRSGGSTPSSS
jgi:ComF family protein